jgi:hypothetical protein
MGPGPAVSAMLARGHGTACGLRSSQSWPAEDSDSCLGTVGADRNDDAGGPSVGYDQPGENASTAPITKAALR